VQARDASSPSWTANPGIVSQLLGDSSEQRVQDWRFRLGGTANDRRFHAFGVEGQAIEERSKLRPIRMFVR
jgi:hypothetical protein